MSESLGSAVTVSTREKALLALLSAYSSSPKTLNSVVLRKGGGLVFRKRRIQPQHIRTKDKCHLRLKLICL